MKIRKIDPCVWEIHGIVLLYGGLGGSGRPKDCDATSLCPSENTEIGELCSMF